MKHHLPPAIAVALITFMLGCGAPTNERVIRKSDFQGEWPFTVAEGTLRCEGDAVTFEANGKVYSVNGTAKSGGKEQGWRSVEEIWTVDTATTNGMVRAGVPYEKAVVRIGIGDVIKDGLRLCK